MKKKILVLMILLVCRQQAVVGSDDSVLAKSKFKVLHGSFGPQYDRKNWTIKTLNVIEKSSVPDEGSADSEQVVSKNIYPDFKEKKVHSTKAAFFIEQAAWDVAPLPKDDETIGIIDLKFKNVLDSEHDCVKIINHQHSAMADKIVFMHLISPTWIQSCPAIADRVHSAENLVAIKISDCGKEAVDLLRKERVDYRVDHPNATKLELIAHAAELRTKYHDIILE